jgi:Lsr2
MQDYLDHGARLKSGFRVKVSGAAKTARQRASHDVSAIRAWAREHGHKVSDRGRIPSDVKEAYDDAH